jgi:hypothetical protein
VPDRTCPSIQCLFRVKFSSLPAIVSPKISQAKALARFSGKIKICDSRGSAFCLCQSIAGRCALRALLCMKRFPSDDTILKLFSALHAGRDSTLLAAVVALAHRSASESTDRPGSHFSAIRRNPAAVLSGRKSASRFDACLIGSLVLSPSGS